MDAVVAAAGDHKLNQYGSGAGLPALVKALKHKLAIQNGLEKCEVMVTAGANQAFTNVVLTLLDSASKAVLFKPYYFNHLMAIQMTGGADNVIFGRCDAESWHPDLSWLEQCLQGKEKPTMVVLVNPNNPTGVLMTKDELQRARHLCEAAGVWLVVDNTYEDFTYDGREHTCVSGPNVINIFSMSKAFGMMGWRLGYIAYPDAELAADSELGFQMAKVQDTIPICVTQISQVAALGALEAGSPWVKQQVQGLAKNREAILDALSPLACGKDSGAAGGEGAIYFWAKLPSGCEEDEAVVSWLVKEHKVCVVPGSACGCPGYVRVAFANLEESKCKQAAAQLKEGLRQLVDQGSKLLQTSPASRNGVGSTAAPCEDM
ncbi:putative uncategorized biosynthetic cluster, variant 2 [Trebouxia sp. C0010 RCD-2024]